MENQIDMAALVKETRKNAIKATCEYLGQESMSEWIGGGAKAAAKFMEELMYNDADIRQMVYDGVTATIKNPEFDYMKHNEEMRQWVKDQVHSALRKELEDIGRFAPNEPM